MLCQSIEILVGMKNFFDILDFYLVNSSGALKESMNEENGRLEFSSLKNYIGLGKIITFIKKILTVNIIQSYL